MNKRMTYFSIALFLIMSSATSAHAAGANFFVNGLMHPLVVPTQLIALFALGLLLGQQGWQHIKVTLPVFLLALTGALIMTQYHVASWNPELLLLLIAAMTGILLTLKLPCYTAVSLIIAIVVAIVIGMDSTPPMIPGLQIRKIYSNLMGTGISVLGLLIIMTLIAYALRNLLQGIILRILGAWSAAGAILVLALLFANTTSA